MTNLTAYNEYITDVIIAVIGYLSAFSLVIRMLISRRPRKAEKKSDAAEAAAPAPQPANDEKGGQTE